jgi:hypothetical protein
MTHSLFGAFCNRSRMKPRLLCTSKFDEVTPATRRKNLITAFALLSFVGGVYYYSISKMTKTVSIFIIADD